MLLWELFIQYMHLCCLVISLQHLVHHLNPFLYNLIVHSFQRHCFVNVCGLLFCLEEYQCCATGQIHVGIFKYNMQ